MELYRMRSYVQGHGDVLPEEQNRDWSGGGYILACESSGPVICQQSHNQELG